MSGELLRRFCEAGGLAVARMGSLRLEARVPHLLCCFSMVFAAPGCSGESDGEEQKVGETGRRPNIILAVFDTTRVDD